MNTFLMWLGGILVAVLTALFAVPHFIDWNGYRGVFEEEASRVFGRDVRVGGAVNVRFLPTPYVRFEKLRIADSSGVTGAPLFSADNFTMWLSVPPLLKGILEARRVELDKPVVRLAVDRGGRPNWTDLAVRQGGLPFLPADVTLQSVFVNGGEIAYDASGVGTLAHLKGIEGELSASGLRGPFSFHGTVATGSGPREIRFSTGEVTEASTTRLQVIVNDDPTHPGGPRHTLEGEVTGLDGKPSFKGSLKSTARLSEAKDAPVMDARANVEASTSAARLDDLIVAFETAATPQIITGSLGASWGARHKVRAELTSRWLDLDHLAVPIAGPVAVKAAGNDAGSPAATPGPGKAAKPLTIARRLFAQVIGALPPADDLDANFSVEQVLLGGEAVSDVHIALKGNGGPLELKTLSASLPGGARIDFSGSVTDAAGSDEAAVDGTVFVGGPSLARVIRWAMPSYERLSSLSDGPFTVNGRMMLGDREVALSDATAELSGNPVRGSLTWRGGEGGRFDLEAEGYEIDSRWFGVERFRLADLVDLSSGGGETADSPDGSGSARGQDVSIKLRAGRFRDGDEAFDNLDLAVASTAKGLEISRLSFVTSDGVGLDLNGRFEGTTKTLRGEAHFTLSASGADGGMSAGRLLVDHGLVAEDDATAIGRALGAFAPYRVAGTVSLAEKSEKAVDITLDGVTADRRVVATLALSEGLADWHAKPLALHLDLETADATQTLSRLLPHLTGRPLAKVRAVADRSAAEGSSPDRVLLAIVGTPDGAMTWTGDARGGEVDATFDVAARMVEKKFAITSGTIDVARAKAGDLFTLAGIGIGADAVRTPVEGRFALTAENGTLSISTSGAKFGASSLEGRLALTYPEAGSGGPVALTGDLSADRLMLAGLMAGILSDGALVAPPALVASRPLPVPPPTLSDALTEGGMDVAEAFTDRPFDLSAVAALSGRIDIAADLFEIDPGLTLADAGLAIAFDGKGGLNVEVKQGRSNAGQLTGSFELSPAAAATGAELKGRLALAGGDLHALLAGPDGTSHAKGAANLEASFAGRGLAPRALVSSLKGEGTLKLSDASLGGLSPAEVSRAAEKVLAAAPEEGTAEDLLPQVRASIEKGDLAFGAADIPFTFVDGAVRFAELSVRQGQGTTTGVTTVDLVRLAVDSAWKIEAPSQADGKPKWPPANVVWVGPLRDVGTIEARVDLSAFERELAVRKMERNVDRLERLRAEDEARAAELRRRQDELERRRTEEAERAREAVRRQLEQQRASQQGGIGQTGGSVSPWQPAPKW